LESQCHELSLAQKALQQPYDAIAAANNSTENMLRSLMNVRIIVAPDSTIRAVNVAACNLLRYVAAEDHLSAGQEQPSHGRGSV
jgi:hypothetical protein